MVSIHAPARGATKDGTISERAYSFNPRARAGCDATVYFFLQSCEVSIHAPARGATPGSLVLFSCACFNPRARAGCDRPDAYFKPIEMFQSTRPRGVRRGRSFSDGRMIVSIHAPARGATLALFAVVAHFKFQSTRPRGVRHNSSDHDEL